MQITVTEYVDGIVVVFPDGEVRRSKHQKWPFRLEPRREGEAWVKLAQADLPTSEFTIRELTKALYGWARGASCGLTQVLSLLKKRGLVERVVGTHRQCFDKSLSFKYIKLDSDLPAKPVQTVEEFAKTQLRELMHRTRLSKEKLIQIVESL